MGAAKTQTKFSRQAKAGVTLSVARITKLLRRLNPDKRLSDRAPIFLSGALEKVVVTVLAQAADHAHHSKSKRVNNIDVIKSVRFDPDLSRAFAGFAFNSIMAANKPIDFILPQEGEDGQKMRREKQRALKLKRAAEKDTATAATALDA